MQPLLANGFRTIAMDMLGFGLSPKLPAPQSVAEMAAGAVALLDGLGVQVAMVLGHHTGAVVAQEMAAQWPDRISALILSAISWVPDSHGGRGDVDHAGVDQVTTAEDGSHLAELWRLRQLYYPPARPDLLDRFMHDALTPGVDPAEGHRAVQRYPMSTRIRQVVAPVLVIVPTGEPWAVESLPSIRAGLTNARAVDVFWLEGGLVPAMEYDAARVAERVKGFVTKIGGAQGASRDDRAAARTEKR